MLIIIPYPTLGLNYLKIPALYTGFIRGILRGVRYAKSLRVLFLHRRSPSWTTLVLYSRVVFIFNEPTKKVRNLYPSSTLHSSDSTHSIVHSFSPFGDNVFFFKIGKCTKIEVRLKVNSHMCMVSGIRKKPIQDPGYRGQKDSQK